MIKHIFFILCLVSLPLYAQVGGSVQIELDAPDNIVAGNSFEITVHLSKGDLKDYSRFSQDIPAGFIASNISSPNADFTFDEERIRIIWLKLPPDQEILVKYKIDVHERLSGTLELGGTFAYVEEGERKFIDVPNKKQVTVMPSPDIDQSLVVDISDFKSIVKSEQPEVQSDFASVIRQEPLLMSNGIVNVTLLVHKPEGTKYLKLEEIIPGGYSFEAIQSNKAIISQAASIAKYVWMKPPSESIFMLKYRLVPILEQAQDALLLHGTITYTEGEMNMVEEIVEMEVSLEALSSAQQLELLKTGIISEEIAAAKTVKKGIADAVPTKKVKPPEPEKPMEVVKSTNNSVLSIPTLDSQSGTYFRVQVAAIKNPYFANVYFSEYDLLRKVKVEQLSGWYKYTVGSVTSHDEAEALRKRILQQTPVKSAFVVAYIDGKRVSIQEAKSL